MGRKIGACTKFLLLWKQKEESGGIYMNIGYQNTLEQKQLLSQTQIQSLQILSMDNVELNDFLQNEYMENPMLEYTDVTAETMGQVEFIQWYDKCQGVYTKNEYEGFHDYQSQPQKKEIPVDEGNQLEFYLLSQLSYNEFTDKQWNMIRFMIECLDHNGYFKTPLTEVVRMNQGTMADAQYCLRKLRQLEPEGIFSSSLKDCLIWQLREAGELEPILYQILEEHMDDIAEGKLSNISRRMKLSTSQVRQYIARIAKLNPRPLIGFDFEKTEFIVPDIIFTYKDKEWDISLNDNWIGNYRFSEYYMRMMKEAKDDVLYQYFQKKLERVRFLMKSIEQRRETMLSISKAILEWQKEFFEGHKERKPMTMSEIAKKIGMHPSTISRGIRGKYLQYPGGTILIKSLFVASAYSKNFALSKADDKEAMTAEQIKNMLKELIQGEDKTRPYSDQKLAILLAEQNIKISRRTVAKYREEMGIKGTFKRKQDE